MENKERIKSYIRKKYYKNDKKIITLSIKDENELYNSLDPSNESLSKNITEYLENNVETLLPLSRVTIRIICDKDINKSHFRKFLKIHYGIKMHNTRRLNRLDRRRKIALLIIAGITLSIAYFTKNIFREIASFFGTLAIWEFCDAIIFFEEEDLIKEYVYNILEKAKIITDEKSF